MVTLSGMSRMTGAAWCPVSYITLANRRVILPGRSHILVRRHAVTALLPGLIHPLDPDRILSPHLDSHLQKPLIVDWDAPCDILVRAKTGPGKTLAYLIPAIESRLNHVKHHAKLAVVNADLESSFRVARRAVGPLILAPTRELAVQIAGDAQKLTTHHSDFEVQLLVGGAGKARQLRDWTESSRDLVVATPGRLRDLLTNDSEFRRGFEDCPMLILDEADTLLSMGFRDDIDAIVSFFRKSPVRQTLLFSATMPRAVRQLASWILSPNHTFIDAAPPPLISTPSRNNEHNARAKLTAPYSKPREHTEQFHTPCPTASDQLPTLLKLLAHDQLQHSSRSKVIIFCPTIQMTQLFSTLLRALVEDVLPDDKTEIMMMHSKMKQPNRDRAFALFRKAGMNQEGRSMVLVSSDVSARGVDYPGVTRIIQLGMPSKETMYIHRVGRMAEGVDSFVPRQGQERSRPTPRADLLLLPWEAGFMNWQLTDLPIKLLPISDLDSQLASLLSQPSILTSEFLKSAVAEVQRRIDPTEVRKTAASLLGYYLPLAPAMRSQPDRVLAGVSSWALECFNISIPAITRFPKKFMEAYEQSTQLGKTKGLFADGLKVAGASSLGKSKSKNRSVWEGTNARRKKWKRWY